MTDAIKLSVVAFERDGLWTAQALEHDIAAFADTLPRVMRKFERAVLGNLSMNRELGRDGLDGIGRAPQAFWDMFERSELNVRPRVEHPGRLRARIQDVRIAEAA